MPKEELLTTEEMSALLPDTPTNDAAKDRDKRRRAVPYNFRRPDRLSKEQVRSLYMLHDLFANNLSSSLPLFLRAVSEVNLISVEQQSYSDYLRGLSDPTTIFTIAAKNLRSVFAIELNSSIAFPTIDRMLGGEGQALSEIRAATELELQVLEGFVTAVTTGYREAWKSLVDLETEIVGRETRPQMLQIVPPNEIVVTIAYQIQIGDANGSMSFCLPVTILEGVINNFNQSIYTPNDSTEPEATASLLRTISEVRFPVTSDLEEVPVAVSDLMGLSVGDVLRTNHTIEKNLKICIANSAKFSGRLASMDGKLIVQITKAAEPTLSKATA